MAKPIEITLVANTRAFVAGTKDVSGALADVADSLNDLVQEAERSGEKLGDALGDNVQDGTRETDQSLTRLERSFRDLATTADEETTRAAKAMDQNLDRGAAQANASLQEVSMEAKQNAAETFSSFDGSATSLLNGIQGTFGGLVASLGPLGMGIGIAGGIAFGLLQAQMDQMGVASDAQKQRIKDLAGQFFDTGKVGQRSLSDISDELKSMATETDDTKTNLGNLKYLAESLKRPLSEITSTYLEGGPALDKLIAKTREQRDALGEQYRASGALAAQRDGALSTEAANLDMIAGKLQKQADAYRAAREAQILAITAGADKYDVATAGLDSIAKGYDGIRDAASQAATAQDGTFDTQKYLAQVEKQKQVMLTFKANIAQMKLTPTEWDEFFSLDQTVQGNLAASWASGDQALKDRIAASLRDGATTGSQQAAVSYDSIMTTATGKKYRAGVEVTVDDSALTRVERRLKDIGRGVLIPIGTTAGRFGNGYV